MPTTNQAPTDKIMTLACKNLKTKDLQAARLCESLAEELAISPSKFDQKICTINYEKNAELPLCKEKDGEVEPAEVYQTYLTYKALVRLPKSEKIFKSIFKYDVQWILNATYHHEVIDRIERIKNDIPTTLKNSVFLRTGALFELIKGEKERGALGIERKSHNGTEADINKALSRKFVRCSEFVTLFYGLGLRLGLEMYPVEIPQVDGDGNDFPHSAVAIFDRKNNKTYFVDIQFSHIFETPPYSEYYLGTERDLFANYIFNKSLVETKNEMTLSKEENIPLIAAELIAPTNEVGLFGLGIYYDKRGEYKKALSYFRLAIKVRPTHKPAKRMLCMRTFDEDGCEKVR